MSSDEQPHSKDAQGKCNKSKRVPQPEVGDVGSFECLNKSKKKDESAGRPLPDESPKRFMPNSGSAVQPPIAANKSEPDPMPLPSAQFRAYLQQKQHEAEKSCLANFTRDYGESNLCKQFVALTSEPVCSDNVDGTGPMVGTLVLIDLRKFSMRNLAVHQRNQHLGVVTCPNTLAELGLAELPGAPNNDTAAIATSIAERLAHHKPDHMQINLMLFKSSSLAINFEKTRFPFPVSFPGCGIDVPGLVMPHHPHLSSQSTDQVHVVRPELFYNDEIEVFSLFQ